MNSVGNNKDKLSEDRERNNKKEVIKHKSIRLIKVLQQRKTQSLL